ncbi:MAG: hypothetical protein J7L51_03980 [Desulfurococcales archaeon]|nr:hypothetical protein [Desulfurococcales archaeon]
MSNAQSSLIEQFNQMLQRIGHPHPWQGEIEDVIGCDEQRRIVIAKTGETLVWVNIVICTPNKCVCMPVSHLTVFAVNGLPSTKRCHEVLKHVFPDWLKYETWEEIRAHIISKVLSGEQPVDAHFI